MDSTIENLVPYLMFEGNCEEALNFYSHILSGKVTIHERYDNPSMEAPDHYRDKVLHASLDMGDQKILASDIYPDVKTRKGTGNASLSITVRNADHGKEIFNQLAEAGHIDIPYEKQFWGSWHGALTDKYNVKWMINSNG